MSTILSGGCACGAVRYESNTAPGFSILCCCRQCQRITGAGHSAQFALPVSAVSIVGDLTFYDLAADSGNTVKSGFCGICGSPVFKKSSGYPEMLFLHAATLDDPGLFSPQKVVWGAGKQPWDYLDPRLQAP